MGKKVNLIFAGLVFAVFAAFLWVEEADAFCVYNKSNKTFNVDQISGGKVAGFGGFMARLRPGESACCHWSNPDCNKGPHKDDPVGLDVWFGFAEAPNPVCKVEIPACGWIEIIATKDYFKCVTYRTCD